MTVYFIKPIGMDGPVKIGCSFIPENRLESLAVWSPFPLEIAVTIPGDHKLERNIHECFFDHWSHREWFHPNDRLTALIAALRAGASIADALDLNDRRGRMASIRTYTDADKLFLSYAHKLSRITQRYRSKGFVLLDSARVTQIMSTWRGGPGLKLGRVKPSDEDLAILDAAIADPLKHFTKYWLRGSLREEKAA